MEIKVKIAKLEEAEQKITTLNLDLKVLLYNLLSFADHYHIVVFKFKMLGETVFFYLFTCVLDASFAYAGCSRKDGQI
jgi:hypothetical protein